MKLKKQLLTAGLDLLIICCLIVNQNFLVLAATEETAVEEEVRQTFEGAQLAQFTPPPMNASFLTLGYKPFGLDVNAGVLGTRVGNSHLAPSFFTSVNARGQAPEQSRTYWDAAAGFAYVAPNSQVFSYPQQPLSEMSVEFMDGIGLEPQKDVMDTQHLISLSIASGLSRAVKLWGPVSLATSLSMTANAWASVADGDEIFRPLPDIVLDQSTALCYQTPAGYFNAAAMGGASAQMLGLDNGLLANHVLVYGDDFTSVDLLSYTQPPAPHGGVALWGDAGKFSYGTQGQVIKTENTLEQKYSMAAGVRVWGVDAGLSGQYRHEDGRAIEFLRQGATLGISASPVRSILGGELDAGFYGNLDHIEFAGAQRDSSSLTGTLNYRWGGSKKSKVTIGAQASFTGSSVTDETVRLPRPEDYDDIQEFLEQLNWLEKNNYIYLGDYGDIDQVPSDIYALAYNMTQSAFLGNMTEGDILAMSATYAHQLGEMAPLTQGNRQLFKSYILDNMAYNALYYEPDRWESYQTMTYEEKRDLMAQWLLEQFPEGSGYIDQDRISSLIDSTGDYMFDAAYAKGNQALLEARLSGEDLNQVTVTRGLTAPDLSARYLIEACRKVRPGR